MKFTAQLKKDDFLILTMTHIPRQMIQENARVCLLSE